MVNIYFKFQGNISSSFKVMGIFCLTQNIRKKGHNLKNIGSRVMGLVGNDVEFDGEYIFQVSS